MAHATPTKTTIVVVPARELLIDHTHRCLMYHQGRITESPVVVTIRYPADIPLQLWIVLNSDGEPKYVDINGWMFDDAVIERLLRKRKIRYAT